MRNNNVLYRLGTVVLAAVIIGAILVAYQMGASSGKPLASNQAYAAEDSAASTIYTYTLAIPAAAFVPQHSLVNYENYGSSMALVAGSDQYFYAPVYLPQGATVTKVSLYYLDTDPSNNITLHLTQNSRLGTSFYMAMVESVNDGYGSKFDTSIDFPIIDNSQYSYHLQLLLDAASIYYMDATIEFTLPSSVCYIPLVMK